MRQQEAKVKDDKANLVMLSVLLTASDFGVEWCGKQKMRWCYEKISIDTGDCVCVCVFRAN